MTETATKLPSVFQIPPIPHWVRGTKLAHCAPVLTAVMEDENTDTSAASDSDVMHVRF